jgi:hypothetical protein
MVAAVRSFYVERSAARSGVGRRDAKIGAVTVIQHTSSDLPLNLHLHVVFLDGA